MMTPTEQYKYDSKFRQIVDILRDELRRSVKFGLLLSMQVKERRIGVANRRVSVSATKPKTATGSNL